MQNVKAEESRMQRLMRSKSVRGSCLQLQGEALSRSSRKVTLPNQRPVYWGKGAPQGPEKLAVFAAGTVSEVLVILAFDIGRLPYHVSVDKVVVQD